jgi:hypothetical protein
MVTVEDETRDELFEAMSNLLAQTAKLRRSGHEGQHKSCPDCERMDDLQLNLDVLITSWLDAQA